MKQNNKTNLNLNKNKTSNAHKNNVKNPIFSIVLKVGLLLIILGILIIISDAKGYFNPDVANNHTLRKWDSFYKLTSNKTDIDVMLFGNSHLYTGINPKNLSLALGTTAFIFASPGTNIQDSYFALKEAMKIHKPKLVIFETYGINDFNPYKLEGSNLTDQIKSFSARKDFVTKIKSTPYLFSLDNYLYAWSTTIRNHDYLFTNTEQLKKNKALINKTSLKKPEKKLYLGRYVRFTSGIKKDVLDKYKTKGAPVNGEDYSYSNYADYYVNKIVRLCNEEEIELMFLTLPMYEKHISDYDAWQNKLSEILKKHSVEWLDLQKMPGYEGFDLFAFENTYRANQHMTYNGSLIATYKLADFIRDSMNVKLPMRQKEIKWQKMFYGEEGYFENYSPSNSDKSNKVICSNKKLRNVTLENCLLLNTNKKKNRKIIAKIDKKLFENLNYKDYKLRLVLKINNGGKEALVTVDLMYDMLHTPNNKLLFTTYLKPIQIDGIVDGAIIKI